MFTPFCMKALLRCESGVLWDPLKEVMDCKLQLICFVDGLSVLIFVFSLPGKANQRLCVLWSTSLPLHGRFLPEYQIPWRQQQQGAASVLALPSQCPHPCHRARGPSWAVSMPWVLLITHSTQQSLAQPLLDPSLFLSNPRTQSLLWKSSWSLSELADSHLDSCFS